MTNDPARDVLFVMEAAGTPAASKTPIGAAKTFRPYDRHQNWLLPPSLDDWLPEGHTARFIDEVVSELLDLSSIYASYVEAAGAPPYDPAMMLKLQLYAYSTGVTSSREMERRCQVDVAFRWLSASVTPDYRSIARFRRRHLDALQDLFVQVLALCAQAGLVKLGKVALDGTKLRASASRHKAMSYNRLGPRIEQLQAEVSSLLAAAEATDQAEDRAFGADQRGDALPAELARRESRLAALRAAKQAIEDDAQAKAQADAQAKAKAEAKVNAKATAQAEAQAKTKADAKGCPVPPNQATPNQATPNQATPNQATPNQATPNQATPNQATPNPTAQRNFTDPEARMMKTRDGFQYAYNGQAVVSEVHQVIIAVGLTQSANDAGQLLPMITETKQNLRKIGIPSRPGVILADAGYCTQANLADIQDAQVTALIATGRLRHGEQVSGVEEEGDLPSEATLRERMAWRLRTASGRSDYARRKAIVEPVFGQMKVRQHAGHLRLRGLIGATGEWNLHAICHNLRKLANARSGFTPAALPA